MMYFKVLLREFIIKFHCQVQVCFVEGECTGEVAGKVRADDENACLSACQENSLCSWFTFYEEAKACVLYGSCSNISEGCEDCVTGQEGCSPQKGNDINVSPKKLAPLMKGPRHNTKTPYGVFVGPSNHQSLASTTYCIEAHSHYSYYLLLHLEDIFGQHDQQEQQKNIWLL